MKEQWTAGGFKSKSEFRKTKSKKPCQDSFFILRDLKNEFLCVAVADGAGSASLSDLGAEVVTRKVCNFLNKKFDLFYESDPFKVKASIIHALRTTLGKVAKKNKVVIRDLASTLLFVSVKKDKIIVGHLGDGIILYDKAYEIKVLSEPENGEFINQTYFVTSGHYKHHLRLYKGKLDDISAFYLMTDGVSNLFYNPKTGLLSKEITEALSSFKDESDAELEKSVTGFMKANVIKKSNDDSTLVVIQKGHTKKTHS